MFLLTKDAGNKDPHYMLLLDDLRKTKKELDIAYANFEHAVDPDLIDSSIYELNAVQLRYKFLLGCVKQFENDKQRILCQESSALISNFIVFR